jgi:SAM-dependent methyltransferase
MTEPCRVCSAPLPKPDYDCSPPSLTSISTCLGTPTRVTVCRHCGHAQSPDLPQIQDFYDSQYKISLQTEAHDQLYEMGDHGPVYRTQYQAELVSKLAIPAGARVLDFGAAKGATLRRLLEVRPDLKPSIFDVSTDYREAWQGWVPECEQVTHALPESWRNRFHLITAHFVLEHVVDPVGTLRTLKSLLAAEGRLFFTVPHCLENTGDLLVVDHINHFTESSLKTAIKAAGMRLETLSKDQFRGAFVVTTTLTNSPSVEKELQESITSDVTAVLEALSVWRTTLQTIDIIPSSIAGRPFAIYGAGFYGAFIANRLATPPVCFLDRNPLLQGRDHLGIPVYAPEECPPHIEHVYAGLNPNKARAILADSGSWLPPGATILYLDATLTD